MSAAAVEQLTLDALDKKRCRICRSNKPLSSFYRRGGTQDGHMRECKVCSNQRVKSWISKNPDERKDIANRYWRNNKESHKAYARYRKYGLTPDQYQDLVDQHGGLCGVCKQPEKLTIDHCHETGIVRGLLCGSCNRALGLLRDNPERMRAAANYVEVHR